MSSLITLFDYVNIINKIYVIEKCLYVFVDLLTYHSVVLFPHCICWQDSNHAYFYQYYCNVSPSFDISQICQLNVVVDVFLFEHYWNLKKLIFEYLCFCMVLHNLRNLHMIMFFVKLHWSYCYCSQPGIGVNLPQVHRRNGLMLNGYIAGRGLGGMVWCNLKLDINIYKISLNFKTDTLSTSKIRTKLSSNMQKVTQKSFTNVVFCVYCQI